MINFTDPEEKISKHFTVKEALYLPQWKVMHIPSLLEQQHIMMHAQNMDAIRDFFDNSINVHCWIRPILNNPESEYHGGDYNALVGGAPKSAHKVAAATDFDIDGLNCDDVRSRILSARLLDKLDMYMEDKPGSNWVHLNSNDGIIRSTRFFKP